MNQRGLLTAGFVLINQTYTATAAAAPAAASEMGNKINGADLE